MVGEELPLLLMARLPFWAAVGAVAVLATDYSVFVERDAGDNPKKPT